jgi:hypothetical protein
VPVTSSGHRRAPRSLPVGPVLAELTGLANQRHDGKLTALFGDDGALMRVVFTARADGRISPATVDRLFKAGLIPNPELLYGPAEWSRAVGADAGGVVRRGRERRVRLVDCQAVYDQMAATAVDGRWTGLLAGLIDQLAAAGTIRAGYQQLVQLLVPNGWIVCRHVGHVAGSPSIYELVRRPEVQQWPCAGPGCDETIASVTPQGFLRHNNSQYHSDRCKQAAKNAAYAARLDRLRRAAGLSPTGRCWLGKEEIEALVARLMIGDQRPASGARAALAVHQRHRMVPARGAPR